MIDLINKLGIKHFRGIYSKDNLPKQIKKECGIINLDTMIGQGTHWVCYQTNDKHTEYFDSFGLKMPKEVETYLNTSNKQIIYSGDEIQEKLFYVDIGAFINYWKDKMEKRILETIHNTKFDMNDQWVNNRFIINHFKKKKKYIYIYINILRGKKDATTFPDKPVS